MSEVLIAIGMLTACGLIGWYISIKERQHQDNKQFRDRMMRQEGKL